MPRTARITLAGIPQHIIQRGNNRQLCFASEQDMIAYAGWLRDYADKFEVDIHAWMLMTNHVHLLVTPYSATSTSKMMQSLGRMYVRYFNREYKRSGTLWEGRFKSCLVQSEQYLLECHRYIEMNPVAAKMVQHPAEYKWSSYRHNAQGKPSSLCTPHPEYTKLGKTTHERQVSYRTLFNGHIDPKIVKRISATTQAGLALGNKQFKQQVKALENQARAAKRKARRDGLKNGNFCVYFDI